MPIEFEEFPKIARLNRECIVTEKLDGTNAQIIITDDGQIGAASRSRLIHVGDDNYGFAGWVERNKTDLLEKLGPGRHFGEWWGNGINRGYGLKEKRFSLFNVSRWNKENLPSCCSVVTELYRGVFASEIVNAIVRNLREFGSMTVPGYMKPEGVVVYHVAAQTLFKVTCEKDDQPKNQS